MAPIDTIVTRGGAPLRRRQRGSEILWQSIDASPDWGYWYSTARQAREYSNASDRVTS
jgi:hypothetical protein